jgi:hypothetical protein
MDREQKFIDLNFTDAMPELMHDYCLSKLISMFPICAWSSKTVNPSLASGVIKSIFETCFHGFVPRTNGKTKNVHSHNFQGTKCASWEGLYISLTLSPSLSHPQ